MTEKRKKAIIRRRIFISLLVCFIAVIIALVAVVIAVIKNGIDTQPGASSNELISSTTVDTNLTDVPDDKTTSKTEYVTYDDVTFDASFSRLLLVNGQNALPQEYDTNVRDDLVIIDDQYLCGNPNTLIHKDVYPYITAMVAAANADNVNLKILSPFRSYDRQSYLFQQQVAAENGDEAAAATVVARPGTSEHNTGLCADFNMVTENFEDTPMFDWMVENAEDYGFILRYPTNKQDITGVIYEPWHWRFVGINAAKEINSLKLTLEEYIEYKQLDPTVDMYSDDK